MATLTISDALANRLQGLAEDNNTSLEVLIDNCLNAHENGFEPHPWSHLLLENAYEGILYTDMAQRVVYANQRCADMLGYTAAEMVGKPLTAFVDNALQPQLREHMQKCQEQGYHYSELTLQCKDGSDKRVQATASNVFDDAGQQIGSMALLTDITEQNQAETILHANLYRTVVKNMAEGVIVRSSDSKLVDCNPAAEHILGLTRDQMLGQNPTDMASEITREDGTPYPLQDYPSNITAQTGKAIKNDVARFNTPNGQVTWTSLTTIPLFMSQSEKPDFVISIFTDITDYRQATDTARASAAYWQYFSDLAFEGLAIIEDGRIIDVNNRLLKILGYERDEVIGRAVLDFVAESDRDYVRAKIAESTELPYVHRSLHKDGTRLMIEAQGRMLDSDGRRLRVTAIRDVSEQRKVERELEKTRALLQAAIEQAPVGMTIADVPSLEIQWKNPAAMKMRGYESLPLTERAKYYNFDAWRISYPDGTLYPFDELPLVRAAFGEEVYAEEVLNGNNRWGLINAVPVRNEEGDIIASFAVFLDITERKQVETALRRSEERYRNLLESAPTAIAVVKFDEQQEPYIVYVNPAMVELYRAQTADDLLGQPLTKFYTQVDDRDKLKERAAAYISGEQRVAPSEFSIQRFDGTTGYITVSSIAIEFENAPAVLGVMTDATAKNLAEAALRRSEERYRTLLEAV